MMRQLTLVALTCIFASSITFAQKGPDIPDSLSVQGLLTDTVGTPVADDDYSLLFKLYKDSVPIWEQTLGTVPVTSGIFNVTLGGTGVASLDTVAFNVPIELGVAIEGDPEISPRTTLVAAPYALAVRGFHAIKATGGGSTSVNVIAGGANNVAADGVVGATISGGGGRTFAAGVPDSVLGDWSTVGGGASNTAAGDYSTVSGGLENRASQTYGTVGGGRGNVAGRLFSTVSGGENNTTVNDYSTVGGGANNLANGYSTVSGGSNNSASNTYGAVGGGQDNVAGHTHATVSGGYQNAANGQYSTIVGGRENVISAQAFYGTILGGRENVVRGVGSVALGQRSRANNSGSFVWHTGINEDDTLATWSNNQWLATVAGGAWFFSTSDTSAGVHLAPGTGTWTNLSSVESKSDVEEVDHLGVLGKVANMQVARWRYNEEPDHVRHMGPFAEDFHDAFGLGRSHRGITTIDASGVALSAIKGLYQLVEEQRAELASQRAEIDRLKAKLDSN